MISSTPCTTGYDRNMPPEEAQAPIEITHFGSGIWSKMRFTAGGLFFVMGPAPLIQSAWRGQKRRGPAPQPAPPARGRPTPPHSIGAEARPLPPLPRALFRAHATY